MGHLLQGSARHRLGFLASVTPKMHRAIFKIQHIDPDNLTNTARRYVMRSLKRSTKTRLQVVLKR